MMDPRQPALHVAPLLHRYGQGKWTLFRANMARQTTLFLRNYSFILTRL